MWHAYFRNTRIEFITTVYVYLSKLSNLLVMFVSVRSHCVRLECGMGQVLIAIYRPLGFSELYKVPPK